MWSSYRKFFISQDKLIKWKRGGNMLVDCNYDKVRLMHEFSTLKWYLLKHAAKDAEKAHHPLCIKMYQEMADSLQKHIDKLKQAIEGLTKEGKFV